MEKYSDSVHMETRAVCGDYKIFHQSPDVLMQSVKETVIPYLQYFDCNVRYSVWFDSMVGIQAHQVFDYE